MSEQPSHGDIMRVLGQIESKVDTNHANAIQIAGRLDKHIEDVAENFEKLDAKISIERDQRLALENKGKGILYATGAGASAMGAAVSAAWAWFNQGN